MERRTSGYGNQVASDIDSDEDISYDGSSLQPGVGHQLAWHMLISVKEQEAFSGATDALLQRRAAIDRQRLLSTRRLNCSLNQGLNFMDQCMNISGYWGRQL